MDNITSVTRRPVREQKNKGATDRRCHCWRSAVCARNLERGIKVNRITQDKDVVRRADVGAWVILRLMPEVGSRK
jgi:hypothetical protein